MNQRPTKQLRDGMLVTYKRGWIVPCGAKDKVRGVWRSHGHILMSNGYKCSWPSGVQVKGNCDVLASWSRP